MEKGLTQKELAAMVSGGLDYTYIGKIEREEQLPSLKILIKLSEALQVPLSSFFREENERLSALSRSGKLVNLAAAREMSLLLKELNQIHREDIPLLIEIVRALNKHRSNAKKGDYSLAETDCAMVAEEGPLYEDKE
jgi:transcriptional regulator with XRE-family HTH domain